MPLDLTHRQRRETLIESPSNFSLSRGRLFYLRPGYARIVALLIEKLVKLAPFGRKVLPDTLRGIKHGPFMPAESTTVIRVVGIAP
jgi:hypothetical protein